MRKNALFLLSIVTSMFMMESAFAGWEWSNPIRIDKNYFNTGSAADLTRVEVVLELDAGFHNCTAAPNNNFAIVSSLYLGQEQLKMLTSVALSAAMADKQVAILFDNDLCDGSSAKVWGIQIIN